MEKTDGSVLHEDNTKQEAYLPIYTHIYMNKNPTHFNPQIRDQSVWKTRAQTVTEPLAWW